MNSTDKEKFQILDALNDEKIIEGIKSRCEVVDDYLLQVGELWATRYPAQAFGGEMNEKMESRKNIKKFLKEELDNDQGKWIYYPWKNKIVHLLKDKFFQELRTARNKLLITQEEQKKFEDYRVGIIGLSVGNSLATTLRVQGGSKTIKIADFDCLSLSNLNRMRVGVTELGLEKTKIAKREILEIDPYSRVIQFDNGVDENNITDFLTNLDLVIDESDDLRIKYIIRKQAKKIKIPVLMLTDNDDGVLLDYYPYHIEKSVPFFHGISDKEILDKLEKVGYDKRKIAGLSSKIVGAKNISKRMEYSLDSVGKNIYSWPQLASAAFMAGSVGCYFIRMLAIGKNFNIKRSLIRPNGLIPCN